MSYLVKAFQQFEKTEWRFDAYDDASIKYKEIFQSSSIYDAGYIYHVGDDGAETIITSFADTYNSVYCDDDDSEDDFYWICPTCGGEFWDGGTSCTCREWEDVLTV